MGAGPLKYIFQAGKGFSLVSFAGSNQTVEDCCGLAAAIAGEKDPVLLAEHQPTQASLRPVVVDLQIPAFTQ